MISVRQSPAAILQLAQQRESSRPTPSHPVGAVLLPPGAVLDCAANPFQLALKPMPVAGAGSRWIIAFGFTCPAGAVLLVAHADAGYYRPLRPLVLFRQRPVTGAGVPQFAPDHHCLFISIPRRLNADAAALLLLMFRNVAARSGSAVDGGQYRTIPAHSGRIWRTTPAAESAAFQQAIREASQSDPELSRPTCGDPTGIATGRLYQTMIEQSRFTHIDVHHPDAVAFAIDPVLVCCSRRLRARECRSTLMIHSDV